MFLARGGLRACKILEEFYIPQSTACFRASLLRWLAPTAHCYTKTNANCLNKKAGTFHG